MVGEKIGVLHPGAMGISLAAAAQKNGYQVYWVPQGRSPQSRERAEQYHLLAAGSLEELCATCSTIICVCPPHAAEDVALQVKAVAYQGLYIDANAIAPQRARRIGQLLAEGGADFVDGGIVGGPAWGPGKTWLHLAGAKAAQAAAQLQAGALVTNVLDGDIGQASALKMCFAAYTKGTTALLCAIVGAAEKLDVREALFQQWSQGNAMADERADQVRQVTSKAWRFSGEMEEIASTFEAVGMPGGFHAAAAEIYGRLAGFKDAGATPSLESVLAALAGQGDKSVE